MEENTSYTYGIQKRKNLKFILIPIILLLIALLMFFIFSRKKDSAKSTVMSFIEALQDYDYNKVSSYIDFEKMVILKSTSNDFYNLNKNLEAVSSMSHDEQCNFKESVSYTKRYIKAIVEEFEFDKAILTVNNIDVSEVDSNDSISKVTVNLEVKKTNDTKTDTITFYVLEENNNYRILAIYGENYF